MVGEKSRGAWTSVAWVGLAASAAVSCAQLIGADWDGYAVEDSCAFLKDPSNCYANFYQDVGNRCGAGPSPGLKGSFVDGEHLDVCFLNGGGQIVFEPPLVLDSFPLQSVAFRRLDAQVQDCGTFSYSGPFNYSVEIKPCGEPRAGADVGPFPQCDDGSGIEDETVGVSGGTVMVASAKGEGELTLTCADGIVHRLNQEHVATRCAEYQETFPHAELESAAPRQPPPNTDPYEIEPFGGFVRFRVYYPPRLANVDAGDVALGPEPEIVEYFNCHIPAPPPLCFNQQKDGLETDIDCGGQFCGARCGDGQACGSDADCVSGSCEVEDGLLKCQPPNDVGAGGSGGQAP